MKKFKYQSALSIFCVCLITIFLNSCSEDDEGLAPYVGSPSLSTIIVEENSFKPKITWVGGFTTVLGVNRGENAVLDSSLIWLIKADANTLRYPIQFGQLPNGVDDLTTQYGGKALDSLNEDEDYTFWVMHQSAWDQVSGETGKFFVIDSLLKDGQALANADTVKLSGSFFANFAKRLDVFINIEGVSTFGQLATISILENRSNKPLIDWEIIQSGVNDSMISAIGLVEGNQYNAGNLLWEVYSEDTTGSQPAYGTLNIISAPLNIGDSLGTQTKVFQSFDLEGLERNKTYYIWIANNIWDGENRLRFASGYAFATFNVK